MASVASKIRSRHSVATKHAAIVEVDKGTKEASVAIKCDISRGLLGDWIRGRDKIFKAVNSGRVDNKRESNMQFPKTEAAAIKWLRISRKGNVARGKRELALVGACT